MKKVLNKEKTIELILDKCNKGIGMSINIDKFNEEIKKPNAEEFILDACTFCEVEPVYEESEFDIQGEIKLSDFDIEELDF